MKSDPPQPSPGTSASRGFGLTDEFFDDLVYWITEDVKVALRLLRLMKVTARDPFHGIGKPEPLRGMQGCWSRRLTNEHRFIYRVTPTTLVCLQARYHY